VLQNKTQSSLRFHAGEMISNDCSQFSSLITGFCTEPTTMYLYNAAWNPGGVNLQLVRQTNIM